MEKIKIYLDSCCFNRPFDELSQDRGRLESEAVLTILDFLQNYLSKLHNPQIRLKRSPKRLLRLRYLSATILNRLIKPMIFSTNTRELEIS